MSNWFPLIHYGIFVLPAAFLGLAYVLKWQPSIPNIALAMMVLIAVPAFYKELFHHQDAPHEALALAAGFLAGYMTAFVGRFLRQRWDQGFVQSPPYVELTSAPPIVTRPWDALPSGAREGLREPGNLGVNDDEILKPLPLKGRHCDIRV